MGNNAEQTPDSCLAAETQLKQLIAQMRVLAPLVSPEALQSAMGEMAEVAEASSPQQEWLRVPVRLSYDDADRPSPEPSASGDAAGSEAAAGEDDARSEAAGSVASLGGRASEASEHSSHSSQQEEPQMWHEGVSGSVGSPGRLWPGGLRVNERGGDGFDQQAPPSAAGDDASEVASEDVTMARQRVGGGGGQRGEWSSGRVEGLRLAHGRDVHCDACDLGSDMGGCKAAYMIS